MRKFCESPHDGKGNEFHAVWEDMRSLLCEIESQTRNMQQRRLGNEIWDTELVLDIYLQLAKIQRTAYLLIRENPEAVSRSLRYSDIEPRNNVLGILGRMIHVQAVIRSQMGLEARVELDRRWCQTIGLACQSSAV